MDWFSSPFLGSNVPITYDEEIETTDPFTGDKVKVIQKRIIGYVFTDNLAKFMDEMKKIQDEVRI